MEKASTRLRALALLVALMFVALTTRLWFLQVLEGPSFRASARSNSVRFEYLEPMRGEIYDRNGKLVVDNTPSLQVRVTRDELGPDAERVVLRLAELLDMDVADLSRAINTKQYYTFQAVPVAEFVDEDVFLYIGEHPELFPGVDVEPTSVRDYPFKGMAAHTLGYVGLVTEEMFEGGLNTRDYGPNDVIGRAGLESVYERFLRGVRGRQKFIVNADGETIREAAQIPPVPGDDLHLAMDVTWQRIAERELGAGMDRARGLLDSSDQPLRATGGVVVIMDSSTGAVRASASLPSYDPRWYVKGLTEDQSNYLDNDDLAPALNRATGLAYTPGSTFKAITSLIADRELDGVDLQGGYYPCVTSYVHGTDEEHPFENWTPVAGISITFAEALRMSCDTFFYTFGSAFYQHWVDHQLSEDAQPLQAALREWGFESPTGIDLPGEATGLVPDAEWAATRPDLFEDGRWQPFGDILTMTGAGNIAVTPMQLAVAYGAIANGGRLCEPYVVEQVTATDGSPVADPRERCGRKLPYPAEDLDYIRQALAGVTSGGTAACAFGGFPLDQVPVAGKTGTAERGDPERQQDTSWFAAMVGPLDDPDYVVVTMVEQGGFGAQVAAPITRAIVERIEGLGDTPQRGCVGEDTEDR